VPVFIAFAAFLLVLYAHRHGIPVASWLGAVGQGSPNKSPRQKSGVRTEFLEMVLDHDSGAMDGTCLKGRFAGSKLSALSQNQLLRLLEEFELSDAQAAKLLEAYLDTRSKDWRDTRSRRKASSGQAPRQSNDLAVGEAYEILGLKPGATEAEISRAHRRLMMKLHPDKGGSPYLATRVNQARDLLLKRGEKSRFARSNV
jgi:DnaJ-like protein